MFEFLKKDFRETYDYIEEQINPQVASRLNSTSVTIMAVVENKLKEIKPDEIIIYNKDNEPITNPKKIGFPNLYHNDEFREFMESEVEFSLDDLMPIYKERNKSSAHLDDLAFKLSKEKIKEQYYIFFIFLKAWFQYQTKKIVRAEWDEEYFQNLFKEPQNTNDTLSDTNSDYIKQSEKQKEKIDKLKAEKTKLKTKISTQADKHDKEKLAWQEKELAYQKLIDEYSAPIKPIDIKQLKSKSMATQIQLEKKEIKPLGNKITAPSKLQNSVNLINISNKNVDIKYTVDSEIIFDFIKKGWFNEALNELNGHDKPYQNDDYAYFLIENEIIDINHLKFGKIFSQANELKQLISHCSNNYATDIVNYLINAYYNYKNQKSTIFGILYQFDFPQRENMLSDFKNYIISQISLCIPLDTQSVINYITSIDKNFDEEIRNLLDLSISKGNFEVAKALNNIILKSAPKDIYSLLCKLQIDCCCSNIDTLSECLDNLSNFDLLKIVLEELNKSNTKQFLSLLNTIIKYIDATTSSNKYKCWDVIYQLTIGICQYDIPERKSIISKVTQYLIKIWSRVNTWKFRDALEDMLTWIDTPSEYLNTCIELASTSLDYDDVDTRFIDKLSTISPDTYISKKLAFYYIYELSAHKTKPLVYVDDIQKFKNLLTDLIKVVPSIKERNNLVTQLISCLYYGISKIKRPSYEVNSNLKMFNIIIRLYAGKDKDTLFDYMLYYAYELIAHKFFSQAKGVLKQALSLKHKEHECCIALLLCDYKASTIDGLINSRTPVIDNDYYKYALSLTKQSNKEKYEEYLNIYTKQKSQIKLTQAKRKQYNSYGLGFLIASMALLTISIIPILSSSASILDILGLLIPAGMSIIISTIFFIVSLSNKTRMKPPQQEKENNLLCKTTNYLWALFFLSIANFIIGLGIIYASLTGPLIFAIMFGSIFILCSIVFLSNNENVQKQYTLKHMVIALILTMVTTFLSVFGLIAIYSSTFKINTSYQYGTLEIKTGINYENTTIEIPATYENQTVRTLNLNCSYNNNVSVIYIFEGIETITLDLTGCYQLTMLIIPTSVEKITPNSLYGVTGSDIYYRGTKKQWESLNYYGLNTYHSIHFNYNG